MALDVMLDLETVGTSASPAILSVGAYAFDPLGEPTEEPPDDADPCAFYRNVRLQSCIDLGLLVDGATVMWWLGQGADARRALFAPDPVPVDNALDMLGRWFRANFDDQQSYVWSHGATFDVPILEEIYRRLPRRVPWFFSKVHDTRTLFDLCGYRLPKADERPGGHHALRDAWAQAAGVQWCWREARAALQARREGVAS